MNDMLVLDDDDIVYTVEDYTKLSSQFSSVLLVASNAEYARIPVAAVKVGILSRSMKIVPSAALERILSSTDMALCTPIVLVCISPFAVLEDAVMLANVAAMETDYFSTLAKNDCWDVTNMVRYLSMLHITYMQHLEEGRVMAIQPAASTEIDSLLHIYDTLVHTDQIDSAKRLITEALRVPTFFITLCHLATRSTPFQSEWEYFSTSLDYLVHEEKRSLGSVQSTSPFMLTLENVIALDIPHVAPMAKHRLNTFIGGYLDDLDLSCTMIIGNAITAATIITGVERVYFELSTRIQYYEESSPLSYTDWRKSRCGSGYETYIASHYAGVKTIPKNYATYMRAMVALRANPNLTVRIESNVLYVGDVHVVPFESVTDTDVNMIIEVDTEDEFNIIAHQHYAVVKRFYPAAELTHTRRGYHITGPERSVNLYRETLAYVLQLHASMTRGAYTSMKRPSPSFILAASLVDSMARLVTLLTTTNIATKYMRRGFGIVDSYYRDHPTWYPALHGDGDFNIHAIPSEIKLLKTINESIL